MTSVAVVGSGLAGFTAYQTLRRGGLQPEEITVFGTDADPVGTWRLRAAAIRQREMRSESDGHTPADLVPGAGTAERVAAPLAQAPDPDGRRPLPPDRRRVPPARRASPRPEPLGRERPSGTRRTGACGRRRLRARRFGRLPPRPPRYRASRAEHAAGTARRPPRDPFLRAPRVRLDGHGRRRGPRGRDRVAERARSRRRGRIRQAPRAGSPSPERPTPLLLPPRPGRLPPPRLRSSGSRTCARCSFLPTRPAATSTSRSPALQRRGAFASRRSVNGTEQVICATGFRQGFEHDPLLAQLVVGARPRDGRGLDRARGGLDGARAHRRDANARARRACRRSGRFPPPTRSPAPSTRRTASSRGSGRVVHAEGTHRVAAGRAAAGAACGMRGRPPSCATGGRSSSSRSWRGSGSRSTSRSGTGCCPTSRPGRCCRSARSSSGC